MSWDNAGTYLSFFAPSWIQEDKQRDTISQLYRRSMTEVLGFSPKNTKQFTPMKPVQDMSMTGTRQG